MLLVPCRAELVNTHALPFFLPALPNTYVIPPRFLLAAIHANPTTEWSIFKWLLFLNSCKAALQYRFLLIHDIVFQLSNPPSPRALSSVPGEGLPGEGQEEGCLETLLTLCPQGGCVALSRQPLLTAGLPLLEGRGHSWWISAHDLKMLGSVLFLLCLKKKQPKTQNSHTERNQAAFFHPLFSPCPVTLLRASCNTSLAQLAERAAGQAKQSDCYPSRAATILHSFFFLFLFPLTFVLLCYCPLLKAGTGFYYLSLCLLSPSLTSFQEFKWTFTNAELCSEGCLKGHCQLTASVYVLKSLLA